MSHRFRNAPIVVAFSTAAMAGSAPASWTPHTIPWEKPNTDGTRFALLEGARDKPGVTFTYAFFIPAGVWDSPHHHCATARVVVARGQLRLGYGDVLDKSRASAFPTGSVLIVPAGARHFDGATEDTIIIGTAIGSWTTTYADTAKASAGTPKP